MTPYETKISAVIEKYLSDLKSPQSESARAHRFSQLLSEVFADQPEIIDGYSNGIEKFLSNTKKGGALKGRADNVFGALIIEFEGVLPKKLEEAREQIRRYAALEWSHEDSAHRTPFIGLATDGTRFYLYSPICESNAAVLGLEDVSLKTLEERDWTLYSGLENYYWLDRIFARREKVAPTGTRIAADFGAESHCFQTARREMKTLWATVENEPAYDVVHEAWDKYLRIVYGDSFEGGDLFLRHTYLATLAKVLAWRRLTPTNETLSKAKIEDLVSGNLFRKRGLQNFLEQDFFSWLARPQTLATTQIIVGRIAALLELYDLEKLSEDVLKTLYQGLVEPAERHYLGEFYTPDWLANRVVDHALDQNEQGSILDPSCGSGSFLYLAIHEKRKRLGDSPATLRHILESVCGADIHPLAVIVAKTNYILALGDSLQKHRGSGTISIPVYLADTLRIPETLMGADEYGIDVDKRLFPLERTLAQDPTRADLSIELQNRWAIANKEHPIPADEKQAEMEKTKFGEFLRAQKLKFSDDELDTLWRGARTLHELLRADRDSIWAYVVKNIYKPLALFDRFDFVLGNPPWIALRYLESEYQKRVRDQVRDYRLVNSSGHLNTQMEIATLFTLRAADLYLKVGGKIGFVVPRSVFSSDQHAGFRAQTFRFLRNGNTLALREAWDLEKVRPLFNVPSCCVWGEKVGLADKPAPKTPLAGRFFSGPLLTKNADWTTAQGSLTETPVEYFLHEKGTRTYWDAGAAGEKTLASPYKERFAQGATLVPRSLWFVEIDGDEGSMGFDPALPPVVSDQRAIAESKEPYKDVKVSGVVESQYLFATLLAADLVPFGHFDFRLCVLPITERLSSPKGAGRVQKWGWAMRDAATARTEGHLEIAEWIDNAEKIFESKRGAKSGASTAVDWLNYSNKITNQSPRKKLTVIYNASGTNLAAAIVENGPKTFEVGPQRVEATGFVVESVTYHFQTDDEAEALFLVSIINSPSLNAVVKPMQAKGLQGERHFHKKIWEFPVPLYDANDTRHQKLVELARECAEIVSARIASEPKLRTMKIGSSRGAIRSGLSVQLTQIDEIVRELMA